jgi:hypothetical protein
MLTNKFKHKWHDLEKLEQVLLNLREDHSYHSNFTSLDRINELQQLFSIINNNLMHYAFEEGDEIQAIRDELQIFRGFMSCIVQEWESCILDIDLISKKLISSTVKKYEFFSSDEDDRVAQRLNFEITEPNIPKQLKAIEKQKPSPKIGKVIEREIYGKPFVPKRNLSEIESAEFEILLDHIKINPQMKLIDTRNKKNGELFLSIYVEPTLDEKRMLIRLIELGLEIWPGKHFLAYD